MKKGQSLPGWKLSREEIKKDLFRILLTDESGQVVQADGTNMDDTIHQCMSMAFEKEKVSERNWNEFLFNFCVNRLIERNVLHTEYSDDAEGSWFIESAKNKLIHDGTKDTIVFQIRNADEWKDAQSINCHDVGFHHLSEIIRQFNN